MSLRSGGPMPIESTHPQYKQNVERWTRCRDCFDGEDAVKHRGDVYLPRLGGMEENDYKAYKTRGMFFGATGRTIQGLAGAVMRKVPRITVPAQMEPWLSDVTQTGISANEFIKQMTMELLTTGRLLGFVDRGAGENDPCRLAWYSAEQVTNWVDDGKAAIVIKEARVSPKVEDPYDATMEDVYRELVLEDGAFKVRIWRRSKAGDLNVSLSGWVMTEEFIPVIKGRPMDAIPAVFVNPMGLTAAIECPPLLDLVNVNLSHYRTMADLEHGRHFTALPTPVAIGVDSSPDRGPLRIGSMAAWMLPMGADAKFLEFSGAGLSSLETAEKDKRDMMAVLGAKMLSQPRKGIQAAETARIEQSADIAVLAGLVTTLEDAFEAMLEHVAVWMGLPADGIQVELNKDFVDTSMDGAMLTALTAALQAGGISPETYLYNLQAGGLLPDDTEIEDELGKVDLAAATPRPMTKTAKPNELQRPTP